MRHPTVPEGFQTSPRRLILNFEVHDVDAEYERLVMQNGLEEVLTLRSEGGWPTLLHYP